jgi:tetratricopeptide (TPR) repeat protein
VGEDFILQDIIHNQFKNKEYQSAEQALRDFLTIHHSKDAINRGTFYLGETLLYQGKYRQALSCFLQVQDRFPNLTTRWIQAALDGYQLPIFQQ